MKTATPSKQCFNGRGIGQGCAIGKLKFYHNAAAPSPDARRLNSAVEETAILKDAMNTAADQLHQTYKRLVCEVGEEQAKIFEIHRMLLDDQDFFDTASSLILEGATAASAVSTAAEHFSKMLSAIDDEYLSARAADLRDVAARVVSILTGSQSNVPHLENDEKYIIAAEDLSPGETVKLDRSKILGFVTFAGSPNSHTAILARALGIPALVGIGTLDATHDGSQAIIDADSGCLYICPDSALLDTYAKRSLQEQQKKQMLSVLRGKPSVTQSGRTVKLYANIGDVSEVDDAIQNDAEGIGLLRSEFLYLSQTKCPDEQALFDAYRQTAEKMQGKTVIIRTLDIGADKQVSYMKLENEQNPAMGLRGIRLSLARPELFTTQLRAICRASAYGKIAVMLPMITLPDEIAQCRKHLADIQRELDSQGIKYDRNMPLGIMIETPSAVIMADKLAGMVDFFSVGTNDLIQYTLAADRQNPAVAPLCDTGLESIMRMIQHVAKITRDAGIWIGICGELAADTQLTQRFVDMGIDELSVSPPYVLPLRAEIIKCQ